MRNATEWTLAGLIGVLLVLFGAMIYPFALALLMGTIMAVLTRPLHRFLVEKHVWPRPAALLVVLLLFIVITGPLSFFVTVAVRQARGFLDSLGAQQGGLSAAVIVDKVVEHLPFHDQWGDAESLRESVTQTVHSLGHTLGQSVIARVANLPETLLHFLLALAACFFVLVEGPQFLDWILAKAPLSSDARRELVRSFRNSAVSVIWATVAVALIEAAIIAIAFVILGIPGVFLASGATFILSWIPFVHSTPVAAAAMIYLYLQGQTGKLAVMAVFAALAGLADQVTRAVVLKGRQDMHPLLGLLAILGGIRVFGLLGVFVGPIVAAVLVSLLNVLP